MQDATWLGLKKYRRVEDSASPSYAPKPRRKVVQTSYVLLFANFGSKGAKSLMNHLAPMASLPKNIISRLKFPNYGQKKACLVEY